MERWLGAFGLVGGVLLAVSCGNEDGKKDPKPADNPDASGMVPGTGGSGGAGGMAGTGGAAGTGGTAGTGGAVGGAAGAAGAPAGGAAGGGAAGASGGAGMAGAAGAGGTAGTAGAAGAAGAGGMMMCGLGEACCTGGTCTGGYHCAGTTCSCVESLSGDVDVRSDGTVIHDHGGIDRIVEEEGTFGMPLSGITQAYGGHWHACARRDDGTVWCWADFSSARGYHLGNGSMGGPGPLYNATQVLEAAAMPLTNVRSLATGTDRCYLATQTCAVKNDGSVWCWGSADVNIFQGDNANQVYATQILESPGVPLTGVDQVTVGTRHVCVLRSGTVSCWGNNVGGPLGQGNTTAQQYPVDVTLPGPAQQVAAGADLTCARISDQVYCWGSNNSGQVGIGEPSMNTDGCINFCKLTPRPVIDGTMMPLTGVAELKVSYLGACARMTDNTLWCWGRSQGNVAGPMVVGGNPVVDVSTWTSCGSGELSDTLRWQTRDDQRINRTNTVTQVCP